MRKYLHQEVVMKVLMLNGSPRKNGNTSIALKEMEKYLNKKELKPS